MTAALLLKIVTNAFVQRLIVLGLEELSKRSDNTVDDQVVAIVKQGLANKVNPIRRVTDVAK